MAADGNCNLLVFLYNNVSDSCRLLVSDVSGRVAKIWHVTVNTHKAFRFLYYILPNGKFENEEGGEREEEGWKGEEKKAEMKEEEADAEEGTEEGGGEE